MGNLRKSLLLSLCATALGLASCGNDEGGGDGGTGTGTGDDGGSGDDGSGDDGTGDDGTGDDGTGDDGTGDDGGNDDEIGPIVGVPNVDDDDRNGNADWLDALFAEDNDIAEFGLPSWYLDGIAAGDTIELTLSGDIDEIRFWRDGAVALGNEGNESHATCELSSDEADATFEVEFGDFYRTGNLAIRLLDSTGAELDRADAVVMSSPLITNHHLQPAEHVWAVSVQSNQSMISVFESVLGSRFIAITGMQDVWVQDELEWATVTGDGQRLNIAMDSIRDRQLDAWVKGLKAPDTEPMTWGTPGTGTTEDKFGNLEATPPHTAGGVEYPFGRIYYGRGASCGPNSILRDFLAAQAIQDPIEIDTCWLCVGHVDEFLSFIPDPSSAKGFKFLISDVDAAYSILDSMPSNTSLPRYQDSHGYSTVGAIVNDSSLRALNEDIQRDYIDPAREQIKSELDLDDADIIRLPGLFERIQCPYKNNAVAAMIPALLNLTVVNLEGEPLRIFVSDPFMRTNTGDQSSDPVIADFRDSLPDEYEIYFVDDWYTYHVMIGEVHCGTNVQRTPTEDWWEVGMHLLGGG